MSDTSQGDIDQCNVCGGGEVDHHLVVEIIDVFGADVWVYKDGFARLVPEVPESPIWDERYIEPDTDRSE